jgi:hypothetical protein
MNGRGQRKADGLKMRTNPLPQPIVTERDESSLHTLSTQIAEYFVPAQNGEA